VTLLPQSWPNVSFAVTVLLLTGLGLPAWAQPRSSPAPGTPSPQWPDVQEEIESLQQDTLDISGFRAEYKTTADAAALAGTEPPFRARPEPPSTISAQRLRHRPPKAAQKAFALGLAAEQKGRRTEALEHFTRAVNLDPSYLKARAEMGVLYSRNGEVSKALEQFERASELEPNSSTLHFNQAWALLSLGRASEAEREARRALALNPGQVDAQRLLSLAVFAQVRSGRTER
jgi:tetratricopeptide (TPR) repeat protein